MSAPQLSADEHQRNLENIMMGWCKFGLYLAGLISVIAVAILVMGTIPRNNPFYGDIQFIMKPSMYVYGVSGYLLVFSMMVAASCGYGMFFHQWPSRGQESSG